MGEKKTSSISQYCEISTCMGVTDCYLTQPLLGKIFWSSLIIFGLGITLVQTYVTFTEYLYESPFKTSISKEASHSGIKFPQITICNFNRAKQSVINETNLDIKVLSAMFQLYPANYDLPMSFLDASEVQTYQDALTKYMTQVNDTDFHNFYRKYGQSANETLITATFANGDAISPESMTEQFTMFGRCWRLDVNKSQQIPGSFAGAKLMLNPQLSEYMTEVVINNYFQLGFAISLAYEDDPIMPDPIYLTPGTATNIVLKATRNTFSKNQYPIKSKPCRKDPTLKILKAGYSPTNCIFDCYMQSINKSCGCILLIDTERDDVRICNLSETIQCAIPKPTDAKQNKLYEQNVQSKASICEAACLVPCHDYMTIESLMSTTKTNINNKAEAIKLLQRIGRIRNWTEEFITEAVENTIMTVVYFSSTDLAVTEIGESTPIMTLIGNVGGQLGLWMGISMFSIIQILYYVFLGCVKGELFCQKKKVQDLQIKTHQLDLNQEINCK